MNSKIKYCFLFISLFLLSCCYTNDSLKIQNNSKKKIYYSTLLKSKDDNSFFANSGGGIIEINSFSNPIVREPILSTLDNLSADGILYFIYYDSIDNEYVNENIKTIIYSKKVIVKKYTKNELEYLKWKIVID